MRFTVLLVLAASACMFGQEKAADTVKKHLAAKIANIAKPSATVRKTLVNHAITDPTYNGSTARMVVIDSDVVIRPSDNYDSGDIPIDFTGAEYVALAMSSDADSTTSGGIGMAWAAPGESYVLTDVMLFDSLTAARFPVYGPTLRIFIVNTEKRPLPVTIKKLTVYACMNYSLPAPEPTSEVRR